MATEDYGRFYYCVKVPEHIASDNDIYIMADGATVTEGGILVLWHLREDDQKTINLALAPGQWIALYAASVLDGSAIAVEHWHGEVLR